MRSKYLFVSALIPGISLIKSQATHVRRAVGTIGAKGAIVPPPIMADQLTLFQPGQGGADYAQLTPPPLRPWYAVNNEYTSSYIPSILLIYLCTLISANFSNELFKCLSISI